MTDTSKEAVERYRPNWVECYMVREGGGTWVRAADYNALAQRCADLEARAEKAVALARSPRRPCGKGGAMSDRSKDDQTILADLARVKVLFQQRSILAHLGEMPPGSKDDQEKGQKEMP